MRARIVLENTVRNIYGEWKEVNGEQLENLRCFIKNVDHMNFMSFDGIGTDENPKNLTIVPKGLLQMSIIRLEVVG